MDTLREEYLRNVCVNRNIVREQIKIIRGYCQHSRKGRAQKHSVGTVLQVQALIERIRGWRMCACEGFHHRKEATARPGHKTFIH